MKTRASSFVTIAAFAVLAVSCSTTVSQLEPLPAETVQTLKFDSVEAKSNVDSITEDDLTKLKTQVETGLADLPQGSTAATVLLSVTEFRVRSGATRFMVGAFAGENILTVKVSIVDDSGTVLSSFEVGRKSNPGGYGSFYDQRSAIIGNVAKAIVDTIAGKRTK